MKIRLIAIAILALLLCATVPMTAMAKPAPNQASVYLAKPVYRTSSYSLGKVVGTATVDTTTWAFTANLKNVKAGNYQLAVSAGPAWTNLLLTTSGKTLEATSAGTYTITGTLPPTAQTHYNNGGVFVLVLLP